MARRLLPGGLRAQLALAIALVTTIALGLSLVAVYRGTGARLRDRIDEDLKTQVAQWDRVRAAAELSAPEDVERFAQGFIESQSYHPASRVFIVDVAGAELAELGLGESPRVGEILAELRRRKLDGELDGRDAELAAARELIEQA